MIDIILNVSGGIIVLNVVLLLVPNGKYEKYVSLVSGLVIILLLFSNFTKIDFEFDYDIFAPKSVSYDDTLLKAELLKQTEEELKRRFLEYTAYKEHIKNISIDYDSRIQKVKITLSDYDFKDEIIKEASAFYDINNSLVVIE